MLDTPSAEKSYADDPGAQKTRDLAYVAQRRAEIAEVQARDAKAAQDKMQAELDVQRFTQSQLSQTKQQLNDNPPHEVVFTEGWCE